MNEVTKKLILQWIYDNHNHHEGAGGSVAMLDIEAGTMSDFDEQESTAKCVDGDEPYVNSLDLEKFIKSL